jgi:hypothetical protein
MGTQTVVTSRLAGGCQVLNLRLSVGAVCANAGALCISRLESNTRDNRQMIFFMMSFLSGFFGSSRVIRINEPIGRQLWFAH